MRSTHFAAAVLALGLVGASLGAAEARDGCGPGFHRGVYGDCRPNVGDRPFAYRPAIYGDRRYGWHRPSRHRRFAGYRGWGWRAGYRHAGWHGGWHRHR